MKLDAWDKNQNNKHSRKLVYETWKTEIHAWFIEKKGVAPPPNDWEAARWTVLKKFGNGDLTCSKSVEMHGRIHLTTPLPISAPVPIPVPSLAPILTPAVAPTLTLALDTEAALRQKAQDAVQNRQSFIAGMNIEFLLGHHGHDGTIARLFKALQRQEEKKKTTTNLAERAGETNGQQAADSDLLPGPSETTETPVETSTDITDHSYYDSLFEVDEEL
ncbi:hypothetical protein NX059_004568 [Plenodomus lindquistii]|nr:hypothetical protein NX059_004568 [Plenodomus lindquistii]